MKDSAKRLSFCYVPNAATPEVAVISSAESLEQLSNNDALEPIRNAIPHSIHARLQGGFAITLSYLGDMANQLLAARDVLDDDAHGFAEAGLALGRAGSMILSAVSERKRWSPGFQPSNRGWISVALKINATGWVILTLFICKSEHQNQSWYEEVPLDWRVGASENRQTSLYDPYQGPHRG
ncbi:hypothetical protein BS50DRAFT_641539 [Corynespora cassiicola Philippines]|uniref:Uncharacterized protein n=1 Tax=Corynespora cassiicola Philippines TaxID=1448308 RepID=A0A2T2N035_CORCC|nr:hypothetical protein BS50DRAFT_641539 [Corynespora cassiicola Philippines]